MLGRTLNRIRPTGPKLQPSFWVVLGQSSTSLSPCPLICQKCNTPVPPLPWGHCEGHATQHMTSNVGQHYQLLAQGARPSSSLPVQPGSAPEWRAQLTTHFPAAPGPQSEGWHCGKVLAEETDTAVCWEIPDRSCTGQKGHILTPLCAQPVPGSPSVVCRDSSWKLSVERLGESSQRYTSMSLRSLI